VARTRIGVDIGSTAVRAAQLSMSGSLPALVRVAQVSLPAGVVSNGEIRDPDQAAEGLRDLWHRGKFKGKEIILGVGNQRVVVREITLPWLSDKELREALPFQVQEFVPIPVEEAVLDFHVLEDFEQEGRRMLRLLLVAAQKVMIQQLVLAADTARLRPVGVDLIPFALVRSVGTLDGGLDQAAGDEAVVDIGAEVTNICAHSQGVPRFVRILPSGGRDVTSAVARSMGIDEDEAERLKRGELSEDDPGRTQEAARIAMTRASAFADEVRSTLDFYTSQTPGAKVSRVLLTGGGSKLSGFSQMLDEHLPVEVVPGRAFHRVRPTLDLSDELIAEAEPLLATAVGLAIPGARG
jgi:type IV pilus assembly protein PilM